MDLYKVFHFFLNEDEESECRRKKIPSYYWYYLRAVEKGRDIKEIKKLIGERINQSLFSHEEIKAITSGITGKIREMVTNFQDGTGSNIQELEKIFRKEISVLLEKVIARRGREKKKKKKKARTPVELISQASGQMLKPILVLSGQAVKDRDCLYFSECWAYAQKYKSRLDCRYCPHQGIE